MPRGLSLRGLLRRHGRSALHGGRKWRRSFRQRDARAPRRWRDEGRHPRASDRDERDGRAAGHAAGSEVERGSGEDGNRDQVVAGDRADEHSLSGKLDPDRGRRAALVSGSAEQGVDARVPC